MVRVAKVGWRGVLTFVRVLLEILSALGTLVSLIQRARRKRETGSDGGDEKANESTKDKQAETKIVNCPSCKSANRIGSGSGSPRCGACRAPLV